MGGPGSGGARKGAGRKKAPPREYGDEFRTKMATALKRKERETGKSLQEVLVDIVYDADTHMNARIGAVRQVVDVLVPKRSESTVNQNVTMQSPVLLPVLQEDPAQGLDVAAVPVQPQKGIH